METDFNHTRLMRFFGWLVHAHPNFWIDVGKLETQLLKGRLARRAVDAPIYITGLARAGTTLLLNILASHPRLTSFKYCDYYGAFTPFAGPTASSAPSDWARRANRSEHMLTA